ncbi:hypothetical protein CJF42_21465 [Pseudoalteromonas sp. NBT06-2]|uniref:hypothetical protein n=1 Tax=Pseudoalteromonas sp. NBT06-2 TaxID=2025950 RepID=UPI000BA62399|nr:hypothetical protein [Pseudoalteromonas sp. NBT06-2]PAJ72406.1 hypothetical protein CJF42_21465 [Pseudoalteromonas sp. NBT06-2]
MKKFLLLLIGVLLTIRIDIPLVTAAFTIVTLISIYFFNRDNANIIHICIGLVAVIVIERLVFLIIPTSSDTIAQVWINNTIFLTHFVFDCILLTFLIFRTSLSRSYCMKYKSEKLQTIVMINAEVAGQEHYKWY